MLLLPAMPGAQSIYKVINPDGTVGYTDRRPDSLDGVEVIRFRAEQQALVQLRIDGSGTTRRAVATNLIHGPLQVELAFRSASNVRALPALPMRAVLPANASVILAEFGPQSAAQSYRLELTLSAVPGDPAARPDDQVYAFPIGGEPWLLSQGWNGRFSHQHPQSRYAIDLQVAEGTPVLAARDGTVMQVERDFEGAGLDLERFAGRANHVRVLHDDGSMAVYAHLAPDSVVVSPGRRVRSGQLLARSGNTGFSSGPHLHFALQANLGMQLVSLPFEMRGPDGLLEIPGSP